MQFTYSEQWLCHSILYLVVEWTFVKSTMGCGWSTKGHSWINTCGQIGKWYNWLLTSLILNLTLKLNPMSWYQIRWLMMHRPSVLWTLTIILYYFYDFFWFLQLYLGMIPDAVILIVLLDILPKQLKWQSWSEPLSAQHTPCNFSLLYIFKLVAFVC